MDCLHWQSIWTTPQWSHWPSSKPTRRKPLDQRVSLPTAHLDRFLEALEQAKTLADMQVISEDLRDHLGIDHVAYHWVDSAGDQYGCGTYSLAWQQRYMEQNYQRIDPVIIGPEYADLITIGVASELEALGFSFIPPANYLT